MEQGGWNLDIEITYVQEIIDTGKFGYCKNKHIRNNGEVNGENLYMK